MYNQICVEREINALPLQLDLGPAYLLLEAHHALDHGDELLAKSHIQHALDMCTQLGKHCLDLLNPVMVNTMLSWYDSHFTTRKAPNIVNDRLKKIPAREVVMITERPIKIYTLGRFSIIINGKPLEFTRKAPKRQMELLKTLISFGSRNVMIEKIADILWPGAEGDAANYSLKTTIMRLRKLLGYKQALIHREGKLSLNAELCWVDSWEFERDLNLQGNDSQRLEKMLALYQGDFMSGELDHHGILPARERLRRKFTKAITRLGYIYEQQQHWPAAIDTYQKGLHIDCLTEGFYQGLMRSYHAQGQDVEVVKTYNQCCENLRNQIDIEPSGATNNLYLSLRN